jgi:hypothetical protein
MTYGFKFFNNNNETVLDDTSTKPWYFGQAPVLQIYDETFAYTDLNKIISEYGTPYTTFLPYDAPGATKWDVYKVRYSVPSAYNCFVCFELPNSGRAIYYSIDKPQAFSGDPYVDISIFVPNTLVALPSDTPKAYIFVTDPIPGGNLSTGYGVHIFNGSQQCVYDSNKKHFQPTSIPFIYVTDPTLYVYADGSVPPGNDNRELNFPANAAVLLPNVEVVYVDIETNQSTHYKCMYRRVDNILRTGVPKLYSKTLTGAYTQSGYLNRGSTGLQPMVILDAAPLNQGYTSPEFPAAYTLSIAPQTLEEGLLNSPELFRKNVAIVTLNTAGVANGTLVPYTITGISSTDINIPLTGNFSVSGNRATITITALADGVTEGIETGTVSLNNGKASATFTITDQQIYTLSVSKTNPEEGQSILVYLNTTNVANGTLVPYTISGIQQADLTVGSLSGNFTVAASGNAGNAQFQLSFAKDGVFDPETATITLPTRGISVNVSVVDVPSGYNEILSLNPTNFTTDQSTLVQIIGGVPYSTFEWIILPTGTNPIDSFNNRWSSAYTASVQSGVLDEFGNFYNTLLGSNFGVGSKTIWIFTTITKNFRSVNALVGAAPTFSLTASNGTKGPLTVNEGTTSTFIINTTNLPNGTLIYPKIVSYFTITNDNTTDVVNSAVNGVAINNNTASFTLQFKADNLTEGQEQFQLVLDYPNGTRRDTFGTIYINDTSTTPATYSVTRSVASVNEGQGMRFTLNTNQPGTLYWTLSGIQLADIALVQRVPGSSSGGY